VIERKKAQALGKKSLGYLSPGKKEEDTLSQFADLQRGRNQRPTVKKKRWNRYDWASLIYRGDADVRPCRTASWQQGISKMAETCRPEADRIPLPKN